MPAVQIRMHIYKQVVKDWLLSAISPLCNCGNEGEIPHGCPYAEEIGGDYDTVCNCCRDCVNQCAMDI